jgi:hypothetical protein
MGAAVPPPEAIRFAGNHARHGCARRPRSVRHLGDPCTVPPEERLPWVLELDEHEMPGIRGASRVGDIRDKVGVQRELGNKAFQVDLVVLQEWSVDQLRVAFQEALAVLLRDVGSVRERFERR